MAFKRATMDFFGAQEIRRRTTFILLVQFSVAVLVSAAAAYLVVMFYWQIANLIANFYRYEYGRPEVPFSWFDLKLFAIVAGGIAALMVGASILRISQLSAPVEYVMELVGASPVTHEVRHPPTQRFINVVEEMAVASGIPVPATYVMTKQYSINALAVGLSPSNAAIAVTNGAINMLTRDELQGVVAHEFSHVLNGDMALNVKLLGILHGVDSIGLAGRRVFDLLVASSKFGIRGEDNVVALLSWLGLFFCLPFLLISYVGVLTGSLIRAAISRQREYLADASAVQFTRNPSGIANALKKIGGLMAGSAVTSAFASITSHFFFARSVSASAVNSLSMASHPSLTKRIRKIDPSFGGEFPYVPSHYNTEMGPLEGLDWLPKREDGATRAWAKPMPVTGLVPQRPGPAIVSPDDVVLSIGVLKADHLAYIEALFSTLPPAVLEAARNLKGAQALVYVFLLNKSADVAKAQTEYVNAQADPAVRDHVNSLVPLRGQMGPETRLPLIDVAVSTLKGLSQAEYDNFEKHVSALVAMDKRTDLFEFAMTTIIKQNLRPLFHRTRPGRLVVDSLLAVHPECMQLLTCLAVALRAEDKSAALSRGVERLDGRSAEHSLEEADCDVAVLESALGRLSLAKPFIKKQVLAACVSCVVQDGRITVAEAELLRAVAEALKLALPPIVVGEAGRHPA